MASETRRLIQVRVDKRATFKRDGYGKKRQLSDSWRKPRGQHNKQREQKKAKGALPKPGFGSPVAVRGMHPSGFYEALVSSVHELGKFDPKTHAVRIMANVGGRTRIGIQEKAINAGFRVLNARAVKTITKQEVPKEPVKEPLRKSIPELKKPKKPAKVKPEPGLKETPVEKDTAPKREKKSPGRKKKTVTAETEVEEKGKKKKTTASPAKTSEKKGVKKSDTPVTKKVRAAPNTRSGKKSKSEVKKDE